MDRLKPIYCFSHSFQETSKFYVFLSLSEKQGMTKHNSSLFTYTLTSGLRIRSFDVELSAPQIGGAGFLDFDSYFEIFHF